MRLGCIFATMAASSSPQYDDGYTEVAVDVDELNASNSKPSGTFVDSVTAAVGEQVATNVQPCLILLTTRPL